MNKTEKIRKLFEEKYQVVAINYDCNKPLPKKKNVVAVEIADDGTVYVHGIGGVSCVKV